LSESGHMEFPGGKKFAFSILDDTDDATLANVKPVYAALRNAGMRTTKTVWPMGCPEGSRLFFAGETLENEAYLKFVHELAAQGFEIASHGATMESSLRERTLRGLEFLKNEFGSYPRLFCNHGFNQDNLYWGSKRFQSALFRGLLSWAKGRRSITYYGDDENSPYFWGDCARTYIQYVRNFTFRRLNMLEANPDMPYRLRGTKYVNFWFSTSDAPDVGAFNRLLTRERLDQLERDGGVCIVSTHLGKGFATDGKLDQDTDRILRYLSGRPGWYVPVSELLDYLRVKQGGGELSDWTRFKLEWLYILDKLKLAF
jgi:hypothetical protein